MPKSRSLHSGAEINRRVGLSRVLGFIKKYFFTLLPIIYILIISIYMLWHRAWFSPDQFFAFAIIITLIIGRIRQFLQDWIPMLLLLFGYEYLRGIVPLISHNVHIFPMIKADLLLFGTLPTIKLQEMLFTNQTARWYDYMAVLLYISHFIIPMFIAFLFWLVDKTYFRKFSQSFLLLSYLAFLTFIIFPAMPPWMASIQGYIPPLQKIMDQVLATFAHPIYVPSIYQFFGADLVAAFPSIHAAYPWLIFLFIFNLSKKAGLLVIPYVLGVWFSVVYLGEHYVVDILGGVIYASLAYYIIMHVNMLKIIKQRITYLFLGYKDIE
jgi:hypothetical protein